MKKYFNHRIKKAVVVDSLVTIESLDISQSFTYPIETHDFYELVLLTKGTLGITAGAETFVLEAPAAVLHPPMEFHSLRAAEGTTPHIIIFSFAVSQIPTQSKRIFALSEEQIAVARRALSLIEDSMEMDGIGITGKRPQKSGEV